MSFSGVDLNLLVALDAELEAELRTLRRKKYD